LLDDPLTSAESAWFARWFGEGNFEEGNAKGTSYRTRGSIGRWCAAINPNCRYRYACAEFGTYHPLSVLACLRAENQARHWGNTESIATSRAKKRIREMFCPKDPTWRHYSLKEGLRLIGQSLRALSYNEIT
jgi:hypothetical protein